MMGLCARHSESKMKRRQGAKIKEAPFLSRVLSSPYAYPFLFLYPSIFLCSIKGLEPSKGTSSQIFLLQEIPFWLKHQSIRFPDESEIDCENLNAWENQGII